MNKRLNETRLKSKLLGAGYDGEQKLIEKLKTNLSSNFTIESFDDKPYLSYDILISNKNNDKTLRMEVECYTESWEFDTLEMLDNVWFYGFNIPARKILKLDNENQKPKLDNENNFLLKNENESFDLFIKINKNCSKFFTITFNNIVNNIKTKDFKIKEIKNKYDKTSNTNFFVLIDKKSAQQQILKCNLLLDDWDRLINWITIKLT